MMDPAPARDDAPAPGSLPPIGWIGLGEMGLPMSANLVAAGHVVHGFDLDAERCAAAEAAGVRIAGSVAELVEHGELLVTMLRTGAQTEALLLGEEGIAALAGGGPRDVVVMSTLDPPSMERLAEACAEHGLTIFDVPVSGGVRGAEAASLSIMASGEPAGLERIRPLLEPLGARVHLLGERPGMAQAAKLANQVMMAVAIAGTYEALNLAGEYGMEPEPVIEAVLDGTGASWPLAHWDWMRGLWEDYEPENALDILDKDLKAVMAALRAQGAEMPVTETTFTRLTELWDRSREAAATRDRSSG